MPTLPSTVHHLSVRPAMSGLLLVTPTLAFAVLLPDALALEWLAVVLAVVAAIYVGFALRDARPKPLMIELVFAGITLSLVLAGLWWHPWMLALGYFLHGVWDLLHTGRRRVIDTQLPWWYALFCIAFDWPVAAFMMWRWS